MQKKIIAIIPARGGSKGVPRKNIKKLDGKPLIYYVIKAAKESKLLDDFYVSTEDREIKKIVTKYNIKIIDRPKYLAGDKTSGVDVTKHALNYLKKHEKLDIENIVILSVTTPFKTANDIDKAISKFVKSNADYLVSVSETHTPIEWMYNIKQGKLSTISKKNSNLTRRQDASPSYFLNGAIYVAKIKSILKYNSILGKNMIPYIMPAERSFDIDTLFDFTICSLLMKNLKKNNSN